MKRVLIRTEASPAVGLGHAMRCLWIAKGLSDDWADEVMVLLEPVQVIEEIAFKYGIQLIGNDVGAVPDTLTDAQIVIRYEPDLVVVDSMNVTDEWVQHIRDCDIPVVLISGTHGPDFDADGCLWPESCPEDKPLNDNFVCGEKFIPLAPGYWDTPQCNHTEEIKNILITFGGIDHYDVSSSAIRALDEIFSNTIRMRVVVGAFYENLNEIGKAVESSHHDIEIIEQPRGLFQHLEWCDLLISAGGTTLFEACAMGAPSIGVSIWPLQRPAVRSVASIGAALEINFESSEEFSAQLKEHVSKLKNSPPLLTQMSRAGQKFVDGQGAKRIAFWLQQVVN